MYRNYTSRPTCYDLKQLFEGNRVYLWYLLFFLDTSGHPLGICVCVVSTFERQHPINGRSHREGFSQENVGLQVSHSTLPISSWKILFLGTSFHAFGNPDGFQARWVSIALRTWYCVFRDPTIHAFMLPISSNWQPKILSYFYDLFKACWSVSIYPNILLLDDFSVILTWWGFISTSTLLPSR